LSIRKQRLELTWIGKDQRPRLEPRILLEDAEKSYHAKARVTDHDIFDNVLIHGDNLLALKALEQEYTGNVKCVYIDPPFNTGQALPNYDDGVEHSIWLTLMRDRLEIIHKLLSTDGTLFVHIDDNEIGYLIALLDSIFGRNNRLYIVTFKQGSATGHKSINPGCVTTTNFIVIYARDKSAWTPNRVYTGRERDTRYGQFITNPDDSYEEWRFTTLTKAYAIAQGVTEKDARKSVKEFPEKLDEFVLQNARQVIRLARPDYDSVSEAAREMIDESKDTPSRLFRLPREDHSDMYFKGGERILFYADKLKLVDGEYVAGEPLTTLWDDILSNNLHNEGGVEFPKGK
jgi:adenine-specific DNA-methyltransferase